MNTEVVLFEQLKHTIGNDPNVCISKMTHEGELFKIFVVVNSLKKAKALASILKKFYCFNSTKAAVIVIFNGKPAEPFHLQETSNKKELVRDIFDLALSSNSFYDKAVIMEHSQRPETLGDVSILFKKKVVQFFSDNICDFYGNVNKVTSDAFKCVLIDKFFSDIRVNFSITSKYFC